MTEVFIRETCNGFYKIIVRKKGVVWFKSEESFDTPEDALAVAEELRHDFSMMSNLLNLNSTTKILPEPNATRVFRAE